MRPVLFLLPTSTQITLWVPIFFQTRVVYILYILNVSTTMSRFLCFCRRRRRRFYPSHRTTYTNPPYTRIPSLNMLLSYI